MAIDKMALLLKSQELRQHFGEDINSPTDIFALVTTIEKLTLVRYPMSDNLSGMCIKADGSRVIAINSKMSLGRQRFSLAHELYHLYYDENMTAMPSVSQIPASRKRSTRQTAAGSSPALPPARLGTVSPSPATKSLPVR